MKPAFKKLNDELFNGSSLKIENLAVIRGGKRCKITTHHNGHTHQDTVSNDGDFVLVTQGTANG